MTEEFSSWFEGHQCPDGAIEVQVTVLNCDKAQLLQDYMVSKVPSCYISNQDLQSRIALTDRPASEVIQNLVPDRGNVMAGDYGEILTLFFLSETHEAGLHNIKKWRFKQDRQTAAPHSDVISIHCTDPANPSEADFVICAEAKMKSTPNRQYAPIENSIKGATKDTTGRLAKTLVWLKEKAITQGDADQVNLFTRFADKSLDTTFGKKYRAVSIIDIALLNEELLKELELPQQDDSFSVIAIGIENLKNQYETAFARAVAEADND